MFKMGWLRIRELDAFPTSNKNETPTGLGHSVIRGIQDFPHRLVSRSVVPVDPPKTSKKKLQPFLLEALHVLDEHGFWKCGVH